MQVFLGEYLWTTVPVCLRKISPLLVKGKAMLDARWHNWVTNIFYWKYEHVWTSWSYFLQYWCYTKLLFVISLMPQKVKAIMITILTLKQTAAVLVKYVLPSGIKGLKYLEPPIVAEQFWILLNKLNDIFEFRIFSHPLFSHPLNRISSLKNNPHSGILASFKRPLKNKTVSLFSRFCSTSF